MATSSFSAAPTIRSSCAGIASSRARLKRCWKSARECGRPWWCCAKTGRATSGWSAYLVAEATAASMRPRCAARSKRKLPEYMVPSGFVFLDELPLTDNGKIDRKALLNLPPPELPAVSARGNGGQPASEMERTLRAPGRRRWALPSVGLHDNFFDLGAHSLTVAEVHGKLQEAWAARFELVDLFQFPTVSTLAAHLGGAQQPQRPRSPTARSAAAWRASAEKAAMKSSAIAIVGMAGRFPGARNLREFWQNLRDGVESIRDLTRCRAARRRRNAGRSGRSRLRQARRRCSTTCRMFDAAFFGFSPRDASIMDPQHRHFLECAWEALEDAAHPPQQFRWLDRRVCRIGHEHLPDPQSAGQPQAARDARGCSSSSRPATTKMCWPRASRYQLDLRGPSINVQTACSTSLVAVHLACQSLLNFECDMALAGGVTIEIPHGHGYIYREGEILSRDGHCRRSMLRPAARSSAADWVLSCCAASKTRSPTTINIRAVILGSAINNDGARKVGYLAPSVEGQAEVIAEALDFAGVTPRRYLLRGDARNRNCRSAIRSKCAL